MCIERDLRIWKETYGKRLVYMRCQCKKHLSRIEYRYTPKYGKRPMCIERDLRIWKETCLYEAPVQEAPVPNKINICISHIQTYIYIHMSHDV